MRTSPATFAIIALLQGGCAPSSSAPDGGRADASESAVDAAITALPDAQPAAPDATPPAGTGVYLDRCTAAGECASGLCALDIGGTRFCTRSCTGHSQCTSEHVCMAEACHADDTGDPCTQATADTCTTGLCLVDGNGAGQCTRDCTSANDCPAGYACTFAGGSATKICVNIEKPCADAKACGTGICITGTPAVGCTSTCASAADCPQRLTSVGLPAYTCALALGSSVPICVPPDDIRGSDPIGASCSLAGTTDCRSGACAETNVGLGAMCTQACTVQGGCAPGLGCFPLADDGAFLLVCNRGGVRDLAEACAAASDCRSGLCDGDGNVCTRYCNDGLCPTGWTCGPVAGTSFAICRP